MKDDSTTDESNSAAGIDDIEVTMDGDTAGNDSKDSTDDKRTADSSDDSTSDDAATDTKDDADDSADDSGKKTAEKTPALDEDLEAWAKKKGYDKPDNDRERKLLQDLRNGERDFTRERQAKKTATDLDSAIKDATPEAAKADDDGDPLEKDVAALKLELATERATRIRSEYFSANNPSDEEVTAMSEILKEKVDKAPTPTAKRATVEYWTDPENIADWHDLAKIRVAKGADTSEVAEKAKREERERLAKETNSGGPTRSAKSTTTAPKKNELEELWKD